ncbi:MAG TPA: thioredoxin domain-containing protein [Gemmatimonadales bacterium]|nr:thioredoxin domain-containing protein [Gemmatimonadales bacterium]
MCRARHPQYGDFECPSCRNADRVRAALEAATYRARVKEDVFSGLKSGVNGTPTFFMNGERYDGPHGIEPLFETMARLGG